MQNRVTSAFKTRFKHEPEIVVRAPGRVNLLGGHTDYNEGYVLPVALDRAAWIAAASVEAREAAVYAKDLEGNAIFALDSAPPSDGGWADYPRGVAWALQERGLRLAGLEAALTSSVPVGSGLSSSAAVEVAFAYAWLELSGLRLDRREIALVCQRAENAYVGVNCGIMDQMTSAAGAQGHAMLLDCRTLGTELVPLPGWRRDHQARRLRARHHRVRERFQNTSNHCGCEVLMPRAHLPVFPAFSDTRQQRP